jgi:hypothetical protein
MTSVSAPVSNMTAQVKDILFLDTVHLIITARLVQNRETSQVLQEVFVLLVLLSTLRTHTWSAESLIQTPRRSYQRPSKLIDELSSIFQSENELSEKVWHTALLESKV